jgi:hypothetical protein
MYALVKEGWWWTVVKYVPLTLFAMGLIAFLIFWWNHREIGDDSKDPFTVIYRRLYEVEKIPPGWLAITPEGKIIYKETRFVINERGDNWVGEFEILGGKIEDPKILGLWKSSPRKKL